MFVLHCVYSFFISTEEIINKEKDLKSNLCLRELFDTLKCAVGVRKYAIVAIILMSIRNFLLTFWQPIIFGSLSGSNILFEVVYIIILWIQIIASTLVEKEKNNIWTLLIRGVLIGGILFCFSPYKCSELIIVLFLFFVIRFYSINVVLDSKQDNNLKKIVLDENGYVLEKNKLYIAFSKENLKVDNLVPILHSKSGLARLGLFSHITADLLSYDYCGRVMFQLYSSLNVHIYPGMPIGQVSFWKIL